MSIEQIIRVTIAGVILYFMLMMMGELETLKWMLIVIGLTVVALMISKGLKKKN